MNTPVFISYSSKDRRTAETICKALESRGQPCWISCRDVKPGENFQEAIVRALRQARVMLLVFSSNANNSEEIKKEIVLAGRQHVTVIPVRVEDVVPNDAFAYEFATRQWIDLFQDWDREMEVLLQQISQITETTADKPAEIKTAPVVYRDSKAQRALILSSVILLLLVAGIALAWFKPWASPATAPVPMATAGKPKTVPMAATAAPPPAAMAPPPASVVGKPAMAMPESRSALKAGRSVKEAVNAPPPAASTTLAPVPPPAAAAPEAAPAVDSDDGAWTAATTANSRDAFAGYLKAYPSGGHAQEAELQLATLILNAPATGSAFDGHWQTVWSCPNIGKFLGYSYQFEGEVSGGVYHGIKGMAGQPSSMVLNGKLDGDGMAAFAGEVIVGSSMTGLGTARGTASDFHALATFSSGGGNGRRLEGRGCSLSFTKG